MRCTPCGPSAPSPRGDWIGQLCRSDRWVHRRSRCRLGVSLSSMLLTPSHLLVRFARTVPIASRSCMTRKSPTLLIFLVLEVATSGQHLIQYACDPGFGAAWRLSSTGWKERSGMSARQLILRQRLFLCSRAQHSERWVEQAFDDVALQCQSR